jgi:7,8-dihydropterin-6-yl-methyl-4-(beta-D-ribofuranosyl)aminobenzene 5'-phosphate synthase
VGSIIEQALVIDARDGIVVITGCAHPGIVRMVREAQKVVPGEISLLMGGFHLLHASESRLQNIIDKLRHLGVMRILPAHCTGEEGIALFKAEYGKNGIGGGVGRKVISLLTVFTLRRV